MKKEMLVIAIMFSFLVSIVQAQPGDELPSRLTPEKREKMEAMKAAFLTTKLDLTPNEAKAFWPVYNKYQDELHKLRENRFQEMKPLREAKENLTDKDYEKIFDSEISYRQNELDIMKKYHDQLKGTLPNSKLAKLHRAENEFKRHLLQRMKNRGDGATPQHKRKR